MNIICDDCGFEIRSEGCLCCPAADYWSLLEDRPVTPSERRLIKLADYRRDRQPKKAEHP